MKDDEGRMTCCRLCSSSTHWQDVTTRQTYLKWEKYLECRLVVFVVVGGSNKK